MYSSCFALTNLTADCDAVKKVGGVKGKVWIGQKPDLATLTWGTPGEILTMTLGVGKKLATFEGIQFKNTAGSEVAPAENRNLFTQSVSLLLFYKTQTQKKSIQDLLIGDRYFVIIETEAGQLKAYGLDQNPFNPADLGPERGLNVTAGSGGEGTVMADTTGVAITLSGALYDMVNLYKPATSIETVKAQLDALAA